MQHGKKSLERTTGGHWRKGLGAAFDDDEADSDTSFDGFDVQDLFEPPAADFTTFADVDVQQA